MKHPHRPSSSHPVSRSRTRLLVLLCIAQLMVILDISAVNVALPDMAKDLDISGGDIGWTITSYSLIFGSLLLLGGRAADLLGRRRVFLAGLTVFTVSSLASALAGGAATLFAARAGQGLGAAMLSPAALSIIMAAFTHGGERAKALGAWGAVGGAGAAVGVLLGGALTELVDWRLIFLINLPVGLVLAAGALSIVPADSLRPRWRGLDLRGALLATLSVGALVFAASQADTAGWASTSDARARCRGTRGTRRLRRPRAPSQAAARCCSPQVRRRERPSLTGCSTSRVAAGRSETCASPWSSSRPSARVSQASRRFLATPSAGWPSIPTARPAASHTRTRPTSSARSPAPPRSRSSPSASRASGPRSAGGRSRRA